MRIIKRSSFSLIAVSLICVSAAGCAKPGTIPTNQAPVSGSTETVPASVVDQKGYRIAGMVASWPTQYTSIGDLTKDADLIVAGRIGKVTSSEEILDGAGESIDAKITHRSLVVQQAWRFSGGLPASVVLAQTGSIDEKERVISQIIDDPLFRDGESVVLFLKKSSTGNYMVLGGPTGRFVLENGKVTAFSGMGAPVRDMPLEDFAEQVIKSL